MKASTEHLIPIFVNALQTGMRKVEITNLKWEQVDIENREITATRTKTGKRRIIPISQEFYHELQLLKMKNGVCFSIFRSKTGDKKHLKYSRRAF